MAPVVECCVRLAWRHYLPEGAFPEDGSAERAAPQAYAAPARATDLSGLPPAYVLVCDLDPLREAGLAYAGRLMGAGVPVTVRKVPGAWYGFALHAPETRLAAEVTAHWAGHLRAALHGHFQGLSDGSGSGRPGSRDRGRQGR
ncbi:alpha/beta hydrolase [Streptomyces sp. NPDC057743]|uniref:alpha/beta hydrolase n=1 Tax=Streptomyces sp. NPDC057743 TaxID=3346236 RepID=UPI0036C918AE